MRLRFPWLVTRAKLPPDDAIERRAHADRQELESYRRLFAEYVTDRRDCQCVKQFAIPEALRCGLTLEQITVVSDPSG